MLEFIELKKSSCSKKDNIREITIFELGEKFCELCNLYIL